MSFVYDRILCVCRNALGLFVWYFMVPFIVINIMSTTITHVVMLDLGINVVKREIQLHFPYVLSNMMPKIYLEEFAMHSSIVAMWS